MKTPRKYTTATLFMSAVAALVVLPTAPANADIRDCPSGYMCMWRSADYEGQMIKFTSTGTYHPISLAGVESYYNHRSKRTWYHETADGSGDYVCLDPGEKKASGLSGWMDNPKAVWLSTTTNC